MRHEPSTHAPIPLLLSAERSELYKRFFHCMAGTLAYKTTYARVNLRIPA